MFYTVYVLSDVNGSLYKGMTSDLARRLREHASGNTRTTRRMLGLEVVYTETYDTAIAARLREKYLKSAAGRRFLQKRLTANL